IGTGPYEFVEWAPDQHVHVTRYDGYVGSEAEPSGLSGRKDAPTADIYFEIVPDDSTRFSSFLSGHYDIVGVSHDQVGQIDAAADVDLNRYVANQFAVVFNVTSQAGGNPAVRQAVNAAIDADEFLTAVVSDPELYRLNPSFAFEENATWWSEAGAAGVYNQGDAQRAEELYAESGYDGPPLRILTTRDYGGTFYAGAVILQSQLAQAGIEAEIDVYDYATLLQHRNALTDWDIYTGSFLVPSTPTQLLYLTPNYGGLEDPAVGELLGAAAEALTPEAKAEAAADLSAYLWEELPVIVVGDLFTYRAVRDTVSGFDFFDGSAVLWNVDVDH
ncbi:MAG TPA: ABC transporter substrate-binding protein, partial [Actinomycetaceae bacterium]|nr:ABC transporter substrate-binding protein [Actinomycetaceae bacterium]